MTKKEKIEARKRKWQLRVKKAYQTFRLWLWCAGAILVVQLLPLLKNGAATTLAELFPNPTVIIISAGVALVAMALDEKLNGGTLAKTPAAYKRMKNHAVFVGLGALSLIDKISRMFE